MVSSTAHVILDAVQLASEAEVKGLRQLTARHPDILKLELTLRILLTYLPESLDPSLYTGFLSDLVGGNLNVLDEEEPGLEANNLSETEARHRVRSLHLLQLNGPELPPEGSVDEFTRFLLLRSHRIDEETGSLPLLQNLLKPFLERSDYLRTWAISTLLPLLRLDYEYYPQRTPLYSLRAFEKLEGNNAVYTLLSGAAQSKYGQSSSDIGRDLRGLVGPWMYGANSRKRRKLNTDTQSGNNKVPPLKHQSSPEPEQSDQSDQAWSHVNTWLLELSVKDFKQAVSVVEQWEGPKDVDYGGWDVGVQTDNELDSQKATVWYGQAELAILYCTSDASSQTFESMHLVLERIAQSLDLPKPPGLTGNDIASYRHSIPADYFECLSRSHLLYENLLVVSNPITTPSRESLKLASLLLISAATLQSIQYPMTFKKIANLSLFETKLEQQTELGKLLHSVQTTQMRDEKRWKEIRSQLLSLRCRNSTNAETTGFHSSSCRGIFYQVNSIELEVEVLKAFLDAGCNKLAVETYCTPQQHPLPMDTVEKVALEAALVSYDNASNGNRNRGGVKRASDILTAFQKYFPKSKAFTKASALLSATHSLSFYSLILQHGVPFQPVNIRVHPNPISLIGKVLDQNSKSYTKLEDLIEIGRNFVKAGLLRPAEAYYEEQSGSTERQIALIERQIIAMAINAALAEGDFDTAYSYVVNRLSQLGAGSSVDPDDDITWKAAYQAGRAELRSTSGASELRRLEQRMELLSQALLLAPVSEIQDILSTWRSCEEEMNVLLTKETEAEQRWDDRGDHKLPGRYMTDEFSPEPQRPPRESTRNAMNEEAPMGLFDVARGAASALSKTAFPLRSPHSAKVAKLMQSNIISEKSMNSSTSSLLQPFGGSQHEATPGGSESGDGRVRKRDVVSNMVTGGLASGIGWVLGAPPVRQDQQH